MPVEFNMVEQHYQAVLEVTREGATFVDVARRSGVSSGRARVVETVRGRRTAGLADVPSKPDPCPHPSQRSR
jgi:hypothetical protein